jgi:hypothetical protein
MPAPILADALTFPGEHNSKGKWNPRQQRSHVRVPPMIDPGADRVVADRTGDDLVL